MYIEFKVLGGCTLIVDCSQGVGTTIIGSHSLEYQTILVGINIGNNFTIFIIAQVLIATTPGNLWLGIGLNHNIKAYCLSRHATLILESNNFRLRQNISETANINFAEFVLKLQLIATIILMDG